MLEALAAKISLILIFLSPMASTMENFSSPVNEDYGTIIIIRCKILSDEHVFVIDVEYFF